MWKNKFLLQSTNEGVPRMLALDRRSSFVVVIIFPLDSLGEKKSVRYTYIHFYFSYLITVLKAV